MEYVPLYIKIQNYILEQIKKGELKPDDKIPTEKELSEMFNVSRITSSTAIRQLAQQGYVHREKGKGTFVLGNRKEQNYNSYMKYSFETKENDEVESAHKTYDIRSIAATKDIARNLNISQNERVNQIIRMKYIADNPVSCEFIYIPVRLIGELDKTGLPDNMYINKFLSAEKGITIAKNKIYINTIKAGIFESDQLGVEIDIPLVLLEHILYEDIGSPVVFSRLIFNSENYRVCVNFGQYETLTLAK